MSRLYALLERLVFWRRKPELPAGSFALWSEAVRVPDDFDINIVFKDYPGRAIYGEVKVWTEKEPYSVIIDHKHVDVSSPRIVLDEHSLKWLVRQGWMTDSRPKPPQVIGILKAFRWFCDRDSREIIDLVLADLMRDIKRMTVDGRGRGFIRTVVWRHVGGTLGSITWNAFNGLLKRVATTLGLIKQISK